MILIITSPEDVSIESVVEVLRGAQACFTVINTGRINQDIEATLSLNNRSCSGVVGYSDSSLAFSSIGVVWYRKPSIVQIPSTINTKYHEAVLKWNESFLDAIFAILPAVWVNAPQAIHITDVKPVQLREASRLGFRVPDTIVTNSEKELRYFFEKHGGDIIVKTLCYPGFAVGEDYFTFYTSRVKTEHLRNSESLRHSPCIFQEYIPKKVEIRATVVGETVLAAEIHSQESLRTRDDWRRYDLTNTPHSVHELPESIIKRCLMITKHFDLHFSAIDMILTPEGEYVFLEINPNGQWLWIERLTGLPISKEIAHLLMGYDAVRNPPNVL